MKTAIPFVLRDYQKDSIQKTRAARKKGATKAYINLATGTGKTLVFLFLCLEEIRKGGKVLIIAHREKLLQQPREKLALLDPTADIGIIGFGQEEWGHTVTIGGIQTLSCSEVRLDRLEQEKFTLVIWDEVHHVLSQSYQNVMARLKSAFHFGVTATPDRGDGRRVESIFGPALVERSIRRMVDEGHLCDLFPYMITTTTTLDSVQTSKKKHDYIQSELEHVVNCVDRNRLIVETCQKPEYGGPDLSTVCFCAGRAHAQELVEAFCQAGIPAAALLDDTKDHLRDQIYTDFATGKLKVITNVDVCGEGWDADVRRVCLCRPTQSRAKYTQQIGRGTRPAPGKQGCYILDFTDNCTRHALEPVSYEDILEVEIAPGETLKEASTKAHAESAREEQEGKKEKTAKGGEVIGQKVEVLGKFDWQKSKKGAYQVNIGRSRLALIPSEQQPGYYHVGLRFQPNVLAEPRIHKVAENLPLTWAQALAEQKARQLQAGKAGFVDPDAPWRTQPMTKDQAKRLHLLGIHKKLNRGQASDILGKVYSKK